jgi:phosphatidylinositol alpha-mannosyltransferase
VRRTLQDEQFDVLHLHEPMTPAVCVATLALARYDRRHVACAGDLGWMRPALHFWGFLMDRIDARIAVSPMAAESASLAPGRLPRRAERRADPPEADPADRDNTVVFVGRHDPRKGLPTLLRAWPQIHAQTGARLRLIGTDPLQYRLLHARLRFDEASIDVLGIVTNRCARTSCCGQVSVTPALGGASGSCSRRRSRARRPRSRPTFPATRPWRLRSRRAWCRRTTSMH